MCTSGVRRERPCVYVWISTDNWVRVEDYLVLGILPRRSRVLPSKSEGDKRNGHPNCVHHEAMCRLAVINPRNRPERNSKLAWNSKQRCRSKANTKKAEDVKWTHARCTGLLMRSEMETFCIIFLSPPLHFQFTSRAAKTSTLHFNLCSTAVVVCAPES